VTASQKNELQHLRKLFLKLRQTLPRDPKTGMQAKANYLAQIEALGSPIVDSAQERISWLGTIRSLQLFSKTVRAILLALILLLSGTGITYASQNALPSDVLYPVKIAIEDFQLSLSTEDSADAQLLLRFTQRRMNEISSLIVQERYSDLPVSIDQYNEDLLQLAAIIIAYIDEGDPRSELLLSLFLQALADHEALLATLLESTPSSASSDIELAIGFAKIVAQSPEITSYHIETTAEFRGTLDKLDAQGAQICGIDFSIEYSVNFHGAFQPGDSVEVDFVLLDEKYVAASLELEDEQQECELRVHGRLDQRGDTSGQKPWQLAGIDFFADASTEIRDNPKTGDLVQVRAFLNTDGSFLASRIEAESFTPEADNDVKLKDVEPEKGLRGQSLSLLIEGEGTHFGPNSVISLVPSQGIRISNLSVANETLLSVDISIASDAQLGDREIIVTTLNEIAVGADFKIEANQQQENEEGEEAEANHEGDPRLKDIEPDEGQPGQTIDVVLTGDDTHFNSSSSVSFGSGIIVNGISVQSDTHLTANISIANNATFGERVVSVTTGEEVASGQIFEVEAASSSGSLGESTQESPEEPSPTEVNSEEDPHEEIRFTGIVQSKSSGTWQIDGKTIEITSNSEVDDEIEVGDEVAVRAFEYSDGTIEAERIELAED
jgi:hypothetical protein